jgi:hypothetical protein
MANLTCQRWDAGIGGFGFSSSFACINKDNRESRPQKLENDGVRVGSASVYFISFHFISFAIAKVEAN